MRLILLAALTILTAVPATAQAPAQASADPGVLFWTPQRREADFRRMERITPHRIVAAGASARELPAGPPLNLDVSAFMQAERAAGVLVIQDGAIRLERYGLGLTPDDRWVSFSMTKSLVSTLVGAALKDGLIRSLDDPLTDYVPEMAGGGYDGVTVRQLLTMTSGVAWNEDYADPNSDVARMLVVAPDPGVDPTVSYMRRLPRRSEPGAKWHYNTGETNLVGVVLRRAIGRDLAGYLSEKIWRPGGMQADGQWLLDVGGHEVGGCCVSATLRDWGRVGLLALADGQTPDGARVTPEGWFAQATAPSADIGLPGRGYGYLWWSYPDGVYRAQGIFGQTLHIDPRRRLVVVILSAWPTATGSERSAARTAFLEAVVAAVDDGQAGSA